MVWNLNSFRSFEDAKIEASTVTISNIILQFALQQYIQVQDLRKWAVLLSNMFCMFITGLSSCSLDLIHDMNSVGLALTASNSKL